MADLPIVYIDRYYDDDFNAEQPWPRRRRWPGDPAWGAHCEYGDYAEEAAFDDAEHAIAWGREHADLVLVRLGSASDTFYSAGRVLAREELTGTSKAFLTWPPDQWPDYLGPREEKRHS